MTLGVRYGMDLYAAIVIGSIVLGSAIIVARVLGSSHFLATSRARAAREYVRELEGRLKEEQKYGRSMKSKLNALQRGPTIEGEPQDLVALLPEVLPMFADHLPAWAQPLLKNPDVQGWLMGYIRENPERAGALLGKVIKQPAAEGQQQQPQNQYAQPGRSL